MLTAKQAASEYAEREDDMERMAAWVSNWYRPKGDRSAYLTREEKMQCARIGLLRGLRTYRPGTRSTRSGWMFTNAKWAVRLASRDELHARSRAPTEPLDHDHEQVGVVGVAVSETWPEILQGVKLSGREQVVLFMRYWECMTLVDAGKHLDLCHERVRQVQEKALRKLREAKGVA